MKNSFTIFFVVLVCFCQLLMQSCKKNGGCTDPYADNFNPSAEVDDNSCIPPRNKFLGKYAAKYDCTQSISDTQRVEIRADNVNLTDIVIDKLVGHGSRIKATVNRAELIIPFKDYQGNSGHYIRGKGYIVGNTITIEYEYGPFAAPNTVWNRCVVTLTR